MAVGAYNSMAGEPSALEFESPDSPTAPVLIADRPRRPVARLMLDNIPHAKAFWIMQTLGMAQLMLDAGADALDGTVVWYDITHLDNASTHQETTVGDLRRAATESGFVPVERDQVLRARGVLLPNYISTGCERFARSISSD